MAKLPDDIRGVFDRMMPMTAVEHSQMREALLQSYRHQSAPGVPCGFCGAAGRNLALHVVDFYEDKAASPASPPAVLIGENSIGRRWSIPACTECAPPCGRCNLPIAGKWLKRAVEDLRGVAWGKKAQIQLGVCGHLNLFALWKLGERTPYWSASSLNEDYAKGEKTGDFVTATQTDTSDLRMMTMRLTYPEYQKS